MRIIVCCMRSCGSRNDIDRAAGERSEEVMSDQKYFQNALSNFIFEAASGGAIRHLTDLGYTVSEIMERLDVPTPYERVQKAVWQRLLDTGVLLLEEPGSENGREKVTYVRYYDRYGKPSFRRVVTPVEHCGAEKGVIWRESCIDGDSDIAVFLKQKCTENGEESSYVSCDFGLRLYDETESPLYLDVISEKTHREYIRGLPWERRLCYHRLDKRMREIIAALYKGGEYHGICYFGKVGEKVRL
ncbi:MAG: hypothetical protein K2N81_04535 [Acetatifactor sp.]|nr:hypothetical protein [Acetatifactor sp.]